MLESKRPLNMSMSGVIHIGVGKPMVRPEPSNLPKTHVSNLKILSQHSNMQLMIHDNMQNC